ncbi:MAG: pantetheine-phosphate adenylyltransferase [Prevotellaceae bacterium]|jgi:pantetheine-phosphate adenylyltransferase|nr:pantetheine-phosphate adenylyltransferase [Prevotellaceae bacterium]
MNAVFPGSFDPFTIGHEALMHRSLKLFDEITIAVGHNSEKKYMFNIETRVKMIESVFEGNPKIKIKPYKGLTVDLCRSLDIYFLIRGLRTSSDFEFERSIGQINKQLEPQIETVFMLISPEHSAVSSSIVRDILINEGDASIFLPKNLDISQFLSPNFRNNS